LPTKQGHQLIVKKWSEEMGSDPVSLLTFRYSRPRFVTPGKRRENSTWVGSVEASFKMPDWFGEVVFNDDVSTVEAYMPEATFGKQTASIAFYNGRSEEMGSDPV
jgi:hypothetical protein